MAGKGVPAALYAAYASGAVRARAFERRPPADLLARVNRTLRRRGIEGFYCTLAYALFDFRERSLRVANSGLPHPFHYKALTGKAEPLPVSGLPLGTFDGSGYDELSVELSAGDAVVFYSDGVVSNAWHRARASATRSASTGSLNSSVTRKVRCSTAARSASGRRGSSFNMFSRSIALVWLTGRPPRDKYSRIAIPAARRAHTRA